MGLAQFGGRGNSGGGGGSGKEIGEVFLVPKNITSTDFVEEGQTITSAAYPDLFPKVNGTNSTDNFQKFKLFGNGLGAGLGGAKFTFAQAYINGASWYVTTTGGVVSTTDGITFTQRGDLSTVTTGASSNLLWNVPQISVSVMYPDYVAYRIYIFKVGTRICVLNTSGALPAVFYTDNNGTSWSGTLVNNLAALAATTTHNVMFDGTAAVVASATEAYVTTNGTTWTSTGLTLTAAPGMFADATVMIMNSGTTQYRSTNHGANWTTTTNAAAITCRMRTSSGNLIGDAFSTNTTTYQSVDNGANWTSLGSATGAVSSNVNITGSFLAWRYSPTGEIVALAGNAVGTLSNASTAITLRTSSDGGVTWSAARTISGINSTSAMGVWCQWLDMPSGSLPIVISACFNPSFGNRQYFGTPGSVHSLTPLTGAAAELGTVPDVDGYCFMPEDVATNGTNVVMIGNSGGLGNAYAFFNRKYILVGNFTTGFTPVEMPVADRWCGVTWNATAGKYFVTGSTAEFLFSSSDGLTWTSTPTASMTGSVKNTIPRTHGATTFFIPAVRGSSDTATALIFLTAYTNGTIQYFATKFTAVFNRPASAASSSVGRSIMETPMGALSSWVTGVVTTQPPQMYSEDMRWIAAATLSGVLKNMTQIGTTVGGETTVSHGGVIVNRGSATQYATYIDSISTVRNTSAALTATQPVTGLYVNGTTMTLFTYNNTIFTSVDWGATWTQSLLTTIPSTALVIMTKVIGDKVVMFTTTGTYVLGAAADSTTKVVNTGWTGAPAGMKYVVKAKS